MFFFTLSDIQSLHLNWLSYSYENINRKYDGEDITVKLPGDLNVYNIKWLSMWCEKRQVELGHVVIPKDLNVPPYTGNIIAGVSFYHVYQIWNLELIHTTLLYIKVNSLKL